MWRGELGQQRWSTSQSGTAMQQTGPESGDQRANEEDIGGTRSDAGLVGGIGGSVLVLGGLIGTLAGFRLIGALSLRDCTVPIGLGMVTLVIG